MSIEKVERFDTETVIHVCEPTRYGAPDRFRRIVLHHVQRLIAWAHTTSRDHSCLFDNVETDRLLLRNKAILASEAVRDRSPALATTAKEEEHGG